MTTAISLSRADVEARYNTIAELTETGWNTQQIAKHLGITTRTVERARQARGISKPKAPQLTPDEIRRAEQLLDEGCSFNEVARTLGRSYGNSIQRRFPGRGWTRSEGARFAILMRRAGIDKL